MDNKNPSLLYFLIKRRTIVVISKEELFADIITNKTTLTIDCLDEIGAHFIFVKDFQKLYILRNVTHFCYTFLEIC